MDGMTDQLTDEEIVAGLRSLDATEQRVALDALFPDDDVLLTVVGKIVGRTASSTTMDVARIFPALLAVTQQFGGYIGLELGWVPRQPDVSKIIKPDQLLR